MLIVSPVADSALIDGDDGGAQGLDKLKVVRSTIPAVTHVDASARVQTVDRDRHPRLHRLMTRFFDRTGCPVLINTSFNVRGEPIVCTPEDAYNCFMGTDMDVLVLENQVLLKDEQRAGGIDRESYLSRFELD
jgi:carbamoyltransferase